MASPQNPLEEGEEAASERIEKEIGKLVKKLEQEREKEVEEEEDTLISTTVIKVHFTDMMHAMLYHVDLYEKVLSNELSPREAEAKLMEVMVDVERKLLEDLKPVKPKKRKTRKSSSSRSRKRKKKSTSSA